VSLTVLEQHVIADQTCLGQGGLDLLHARLGLAFVMAILVRAARAAPSLTPVLMVELNKKQALTRAMRPGLCRSSSFLLVGKIP
jgi:hypothetical protein